jgi:Fanconi-associated nuclease 1
MNYCYFVLTASKQLRFDSLLNAGAQVEICKVLDANDEANALSRSKKRQKGTNRRSAKGAKGKVRARDSDLESEDEEDDSAN